MSVVKGKDMTIMADGKIIACSRSCVLTTSTSFIETTAPGSGKYATFKPQKNTTTGSLEGVVFLNELGKLTLPDLRVSQFKHQLLNGYFERVSQDNSHYFDNVDFYISNITDTGAAGDFNTFQVDIQVNGAFYMAVVTGITSTGFQLYQPMEAGTTYDLSFNNGSSYTNSGVAAEGFTVTGLAMQTTYQVVRRMHLPGGITKVLPAIIVTTI